MAVYRKRTFGRNARGGRRFRGKVLFKKPTAQNQRKQIFQLSHGLSRLQRQMNANVFYGTYRCNHFNPALGSPYAVVNLTAPQPIAGGTSQWEDCFESNTRMALAKKAYMRSMGIDVLVTLGDENDTPVTFTYFVVSLKPGRGAKAVIEQAGEQLDNLEEGSHYSSQSGGGQPFFGQSSGLVMMDKSRFNIHYIKRFTLSAKKYESGLSNSTQFSGTYKRFYHKLRCGNKPLNDGTSDQQIRDMPEASVPLGSRYYAIMFNDATGVGGTPTWQLNQVVTVRR